MRFFKKRFLFTVFHENESSALQVMHRERFIRGEMKLFIKEKQNQGRKLRKK